MMVGVIVSNIFQYSLRIIIMNELEWVPVAHLFYVFFFCFHCQILAKNRGDGDPWCSLIGWGSWPWCESKSEWEVPKPSVVGEDCSKIWPKMMKHVPSFGLYCMNWNSVNIFVGILKPTLPVRTVEQSSLQGVRGHSSLRFWGLAGAVAGGEWCNYHGIPSWTVPGHVWAVHEVGTPGRMLIVVTQVLTSLWLSSFRSSDGGDLFWWDRWVGPALLRSSLSTPCCADMSIEGGPTNKFINSSSHLGIHTCKPIYSTYIYI